MRSWVGRGFGAMFDGSLGRVEPGLGEGAAVGAGGAVVTAGAAAFGGSRWAANQAFCAGVAQP